MTSRIRESDGHVAYHVHEWNVWKMKWVLKSGFNHMSKEYAIQAAKERSQEIADMLAGNKNVPSPM